MAFGYFPPRDWRHILSNPVACIKAWRRGQDNLIKRLQVKETFRHLDLRPGDNVLEIGAGGLYYAGEIAKRVAETVATDVVAGFEQMLLTRRFPAGLQTKHADCADLPFADKSFDKVFVSEVLPVLDRDKAARCIAEAYRVLRQGGKLVTVNGRQFELMKEVFESPEGQELISRQPEARLLSYDEFHRKYIDLHKTQPWFFEARDKQVRNLLVDAGFIDLEMTWGIGPATEYELCLILLENFVKTGSFLLGENQIRYLGRLEQFERGHLRTEPGFTLYCSGYRR